MTIETTAENWDEERTTPEGKKVRPFTMNFGPQHPGARGGCSHEKASGDKHA